METTAKYKPNIEIASDPEDLARRTVQFFVSTAQEVLKTKKTFRVAISGGQTPKRTFETLAASPIAKALPWNQIQVFWVDERYVPYDSPYSNFRMASEALLKKVPIPPDNIHRIPTDHDDISVAARSYEAQVRSVFGVGDDQVPVFDLVVLGMGTDGHTASLLPNSYAPFDTEDLACVVYTCGENLNRITLTHPVLQVAKRLVVLVSGPEKAGILKEVLTTEPDEVRYPIHILWPVLNKVVWLVDRDAAKGI